MIIDKSIIFLLKMRSKIDNDVHLGQSLNPLNDIVKNSTVDNLSDLPDVFTKIDKLKKIWDHGTMDFDLIRYLSGMVKILRQGQIYNALPKKAYASPNWSDMKTFDFNLILASNTTTNFNNIYLCIPMKIQKKNNTDDDIDATLITVNNFFGHFIKEIDILRYGFYQQIMLSTFIGIWMLC